MPTLFDVAEGTEVATLAAPDQQRREQFHVGPFVGWSPDGRFIASGHGKHVRLWDAKTHEHLKTIATEFNSIGKVSWHPNSKLLAVSGGGGLSTCYVLDVERGSVVAPGPGIGIAHSLAWSPNGAAIALLTDRLNFVDGKSGKLLRRASRQGRCEIIYGQPAFVTADGRRLHAKGTDETTRVEFNTSTGELVKRVKAPTGRMVAVASDGQWHAYEVDRNEKQVTVVSAVDPPVELTLLVPGSSHVWRTDSSGKCLAGAFEQDVILWDSALGEMKNKFAHSAAIWDFQFSPDGSRIATVAADKILRIWRVPSGDPPGDKNPVVVFGSVEVSGDLGREVGRPLLSWLPDGQSVIVALGRQIGQFDVATGKVSQVRAPMGDGANLAVSAAPDGDQWIVRDYHQWVSARDREGEWQPISRNLGTYSQWFPDSRRLLGISHDFGMRGFDMSQRRHMGTLWPLIAGDHWLCVSPTGHYRGSEGIDDHIVYVAQLDDGSHVTLSPPEFQKRFDWKNDPQQATLLKLEP